MHPWSTVGWVGSSVDLGLAFSHFWESTSYLSLSRMALVVETGGPKECTNSPEAQA